MAGNKYHGVNQTPVSLCGASGARFRRTRRLWGGLCEHGFFPRSGGHSGKAGRDGARRERSGGAISGGRSSSDRAGHREPAQRAGHPSRTRTSRETRSMSTPNEFHRISRLPPYVFEQVNKLKAEARARGEDIIDFGMGNPDMPTPKH